MRNRKSLFLLLSLCSLLMLTLFPINSRGQADIPYTFNDDVLFSSSELGRQSSIDDSSNTFNVRPRQEITNHFNATYSFENDIDGAEPIGWVVAENVDCYGLINTTLSGHDKILNMSDNNGAGLVSANIGIVQGLDTTIEFFFTKSSIAVSKRIEISLREGATNLVQLRFDSDDSKYYDGGAYQNLQLNFMTADIFYHFKFILDDTANTFDCYINGILVDAGAGLTYWNPSIFGVDILSITTSSGNTGYSGYFDAFGWDIDIDYNIGDNLVPYRQAYSILDDQYEVDEWQFTYNSTTRTEYVDGNDDPSGWTDYQDNEPFTDKVNTLFLGFSSTAPSWGYQRFGVVHCDENVGGTGLFRNFDGIDDIYYNITFNFEINRLDDTDVGANAVVMTISDIYTSAITAVYLRRTGQVEIFHDGGSTTLGAFGTTGNYSVSFFLNFQSRIFNFTMLDWDDRSLLYSFTGGFHNASANNIDRVLYNHVDTSAEVDSYLMSVSIYDTEGSLSDDVGILSYDELAVPVIASDGTWFFNEFNLLHLEGNFEDVSVFINKFGGLVFWLFLDWTNIETEVFVNFYDDDDHVETFLSDVSVWLFYNFTFDNIKFSGVKLTEGANDYRLEFTFGNVATNESFFFVDSSNRLQFRHIADDSNLEFIQARFNIDDLPSDDSAIFFRSAINDVAQGVFRVNFSTVSNLFPLLKIEGNSRIILSQGLTIRDYIILITDNDDDAISGLTAGFVSHVELIFMSNIAVTIITTSLIDIIIPLVMIIIPTLGLSARVGKNGIIPIFLLMSLLLVVTEVIPVWLFFVIAVSCSLFIFIKRQEALF